METKLNVEANFRKWWVDNNGSQDYEHMMNEGAPMLSIIEMIFDAGQKAGIEAAGKEIEQLQARIKALEEALIHIEEYWNRDQNDVAMADALHEICETALEALKETPNEHDT